MGGAQTTRSVASAVIWAVLFIAGIRIGLVVSIPIRVQDMYGSPGSRQHVNSSGMYRRKSRASPEPSGGAE